MSRLLGTVLQWTLGCMYFLELWFSLDLLSLILSFISFLTLATFPVDYLASTLKTCPNAWCALCASGGSRLSVVRMLATRVGSAHVFLPLWLYSHPGNTVAEQSFLLSSHGAVASQPLLLFMCCFSAAPRGRVYFLSPTAEETQTHGCSETCLSSDSRSDVLKQAIYKMVNPVNPAERPISSSFCPYAHSLPTSLSLCCI